MTAQMRNRRQPAEPRARRPARPGALRRHRRGGHVRHRADHAGPGISVSGSDARDSALLGELRALGASVHIGHAAGNLGSLGPGDTLVVSSAIRPDNPELAEATRRGLRVLHRAAALASVMVGRRVIAIAGTHGKTTTTSMLTTVLRECGADPGYVIGGILTETGLGAEDGPAWTSSPRPTKATGRSCCSRPTWPSSPTSRPTTWTTTRAWRTSRRRSPRSASRSPAWC